MWPYLGEVKRAQANEAIRLVEEQYTSGLYRMRKAHSPVRIDVDALHQVARTRGEIERAWAAGFLDGEGCFGLNRAKVRKRGPAWYRLRVSADQHGIVGGPPEVLVRLQRALGIGRIERHSDPDDYKWSAEGSTTMERILAMTAPVVGRPETPRWIGGTRKVQRPSSTERRRNTLRTRA
jgi:hypothetical protein